MEEIKNLQKETDLKLKETFNEKQVKESLLEEIKALMGVNEKRSREDEDEDGDEKQRREAKRMASFGSSFWRQRIESQLNTISGGYLRVKALTISEEDVERLILSVDDNFTDQFNVQTEVEETEAVEETKCVSTDSGSHSLASAFGPNDELRLDDQEEQAKGSILGKESGDESVFIIPLKQRHSSWSSEGEMASNRQSVPNMEQDQKLSTPRDTVRTYTNCKDGSPLSSIKKDMEQKRENLLLRLKSGLKTIRKRVPKDSYSVHIPQDVSRRSLFPDIVECKGCSKPFPCMKTASSGTRPSPQYFFHCINECISYQALGLTKQCDVCKISFLNIQGLTMHKKTHVKNNASTRRLLTSKTKSAALQGPAITLNIPKWMVRSEFIRISKCKQFPKKVECKGCGDEFPSSSGSKSKPIHSLEYYVHCIEGCREFANLGLITDCERCECKFIDQQSAANHACSGEKLSLN